MNIETMIVLVVVGSYVAGLASGYVWGMKDVNNIAAKIRGQYERYWEDKFGTPSPAAVVESKPGEAKVINLRTKKGLPKK